MKDTRMVVFHEKLEIGQSIKENSHFCQLLNAFPLQELLSPEPTKKEYEPPNLCVEVV